MSPRSLTALLAALVAALVLLLIMATLVPPETREAWGPLVIALGIAVGLASIGLMIALVRRHSLETVSKEQEAERAFERSVRLGLPASDPSASGRPPALRSSAASAGGGGSADVCAPSPPAPAAAAAPAAGGLEALLGQLRLARLDPKVEGDVREGPWAGSVILRLGREETALVLTRSPTPEEWADLFPRHDRVFIPHGQGHWIAVERLEGLVRSRLDLPL